MKFTIAPWIYNKIQDSAGRYNFTLCWDKITDEYGENIAFTVYGTTIRETEKAVYASLKYWNLNKAGRYITDAPVESGFKVWIPKSALK